VTGKARTAQWCGLAFILDCLGLGRIDSVSKANERSSRSRDLNSFKSWICSHLCWRDSRKGAKLGKGSGEKMSWGAVGPCRAGAQKAGGVYKGRSGKDGSCSEW
jgi:hypothetical protein